MNALAVITVQVNSAAALAQLRALQAQSSKTAMGVGAVGRQAQWGIPYLSKWGNQVQWAGRQLIYNFTMPIALAIGAATKFALDNEKAMTRVTKVYGDNSKVFNRLAKTEIPALGEAFEALSNKFGVAQQDVINIGADWAAAGASGLALAKSVDLTLQTMILGEIDAKTATEQLIAIQAQYGQSTQQLTKTIEILNMVENQTGASMKGLMDGMSRAAGVARTAGIDVEHLAAMMAALVPATGSAATAGNGLRTIISRVLSPTQEAVEVMREMGVEVDKMSWQGMTATERLEAMAKQFNNLSDAQQAHVSTVMASRWQINRFVTLMRDVTNENGYYQKSLAATTDEQRLFTQRQKELNRVLTSNPQMLKQTWIILQNAMAKVIVPLLPYIVYLAQQLTMLAQKFANLDPEIQKLVLAGLVLLALVGPLARYIGSISNLIGLLAAAVHFAAAKFIWLGTALVAPIGWLYKLAALPFRLIAAGFGLIGGAASAVATMLGPMARVILGTVGAAVAGFAAPLLAAIRGFSAPLIAAWRLMTIQLQLVWAGFQFAVLGMWTAFSIGMQTAGAAMMIGLRGIIAQGGAAIVALWRILWARTAAVAVVARAQLIVIWATMLTSMRTMMAGIRAGIIMMWTALWTTLVAIATWGRTAIMTIWATTLVAGRAFIGGLRGIVMAAGLMIARIPAMFAVAMRALPLIMAMSFRAMITMMVRFAPLLLRALTGPIGLAVMAIGGLLYAFRDKIATAFTAIVSYFKDLGTSLPQFFAPVGDFFQALGQKIMDAFWALPQGVRDAMITVLTIVRDAALQVYEWMSYLNPFATHSPSLVSQVTDGMDVIGKQYARAKDFGKPFQQVKRDIEAAIAAQEKVVERWSDKLDDANAALDRQTRYLDVLQGKLDAVTARYQAHQDAISRYADAPIKGMGEMENKIFRNEMAQKKLRLEMLKWEKANGTIDDMVSRLGNLHGELEMLQGQARELVNAGAGSDILGPINAQIAALEAQAKAVNGAIENSPVNKMQERMAELERQGEILQLQNDIKYDPMIRTIDRLANAQKELSYDRIVHGIKSEQAAMDALAPRMNHLTQLVAQQQAVVDKHAAARDKISRRYDREQEQLDDMRAKYDALTEAMDKNKDAANAASKAAAGYTPQGVETFRAGAGANWADPGNFRKIGRQGGLTDQSQAIKDFAEKTNEDMASIFGTFDMFAPIKDAWHRTWGWLKEHIGPVVSTLGDGIATAVKAIPNPFTGLGGDNSVTRALSKTFDTIVDIFRTLGRWLARAGRLFLPDIKRIWNAIVDAAQKAWDEIGPELEKFGDLIEPAAKAIQNLWKILKPILGFLAVVVLGVIKLIVTVLSKTIGPVLDMVIDVVKNVIRILRGVLEFIVGVFSGDWEMAWQGIKDIFLGTFWGIVDIIKNFGKIIWGIVSGIVTGIWEFFKWLWDELVGHSIVPDIVNGIISVFHKLADLAKWVWNEVLEPIWSFFKKLWDKVKGWLKLWWAGIKKEWEILKKVADWLWDHVLEPIWNKIKDLWNDYVKPGLKAWWEGIKLAWNALTRVAGWVWDNVLKPVFTKVKELWSNYVKPAFAGWWDGIKTVWDSLTRLGGWVWDNVMKPVYDKIKEGWQKVRDWLAGAKDLLTNPVKSIVNVVISAVNALIKGLNKISDVLPGIDWEINLIEKFAAGGIPSRRVGGGFKTNGARAIVGEGRSGHPEWVIPSDPKYRDRAQTLLSAAAARIGMVATPGVSLKGAYGDTASDMRKVMAAKIGAGGLPEYGLGGIIGDYLGGTKDLLSKGWDMAKGNDSIRTIASFYFKPYAAIARHLMEDVSWPPARGAGNFAIDEVQRWIAAADSVYEKAAQQGLVGGPAVKRAQAWAKSQVGKPYVWGGVGPDGYDCSGFMSALTNVLRGQNPFGRVGTTSTFPWGGFSSGFDKMGFTIGSTNSYAGGVGHMAGTLGGLNVESAGGIGVRVGASARGYNDGGFSTVAHMTGLQYGGIVRRRAGGLLARIGEGSNDEAVMPLPKNWRTDVFGNKSGGDTYINIETVEMPNITSGEDAKTFVKNLEMLAKG